MAYKYQSGLAQMSGALTQEGAFKLHNQAGSEVASVLQSGIVSGSAAGKFSTLSIDSVEVIDAAQGLKNIASLDATTEATVEAAIDTLANLASMGSDGSELEALGSLDVAQGLKIANSEVISSARAVSNITSVDGSGDLTMGSITMTGFSVDSSGNSSVASLASTSTISGSGQLQGASLAVDGTATANALTLAAASISAAGAASGLTSVDGSGDLTMGTITMSGFSVDADGDVALKSLSVDDNSYIGPDSVSDLIQLQSDGDIIIKDGAYDFDIASHDGTNGLLLGGVLVNASAADLNFTNVAAAGTAEASKAVVLDASKDITGINQLTASYFKGDGSGITNINVENLDAVGSDTYVQFNQNGEFGANANFTYDGSGSVATSVMLSSADLKATNLVEGRLPLVSTAGKLDDDEVIGYNLVRNPMMGGYIGLAVSSSASGSSYMFDGMTAIYNPSDELVYRVTPQEATSRVNLKVSGASDVGLDVASTMTGGASITSVGHIGIGSSGEFEAMMFSTGVVSGSDAGKFSTLQIDSVEVFSAAQALQNVASLDATTEATIEAAIDTLANLGSMGSNGAELEALGSLDVAQTFKIANSQLSDASKNLTAAGVSGSGNFNIGGTLNADNLASVTVDLTADMMMIDDGASGAIKITSLAAYATALAAGANEGLKSEAGRLGLDLNDLAGAAVNVAADSIAIVDADDNGSKKESIADLVTAMAGAGLTATNGVLSADSAVAPNAIGDEAATLAEGFNYGNADLTSARVWSLPAPQEVGDIVHVKAPANASSTLTITVSGGTIDGAASVVLESPYAAVSLICVDVGSDLWRLY